MKKYSFLIYHKEYEEFLNGLQELGVVHIIEKQAGEIEDENLREQYKVANQLTSVIKFLEKRNIERQTADRQTNGFSILEEIQNIQQQKEQNIQKLATVRKDISLVEPWGNFSFDNIKRLREHNLNIRFFICSSGKFKEQWNTQYNLEIIKSIGGQTYFIIVQKENEPIEIDAEEVKVPEKSLSELLKNENDVIQVIKKSEEIFDLYAKKYIPLLEDTCIMLKEKIDLNKVKLNTEKHADEKLLLLEGWIPEEKENNLISFLNKTGVYFIDSKPEKTDNVPIKLKNNWFSRLFEPISKMFMLPNYAELDLTPFFAPFFMLFFGFCMGDAGYGLIFIILASLYKLKAKKELKPLLSLVQVLGFSTIIFGAISGTFFGMNLIDSGYTITNQSIVELKDHNISSVVTDSLLTIKGELYKTRNEFESIIANKIGNHKFNELRSEIFKSSDTNFKLIKNFRYMLLDANSMFNFALLLGIIQIIFGMFVKILNIIKQKSILYALPTIGWILLVVGGTGIFILNKFNIISSPKIYVYTLLAVFLILIFGFSNPKNIFSSIGSGFADLYFTSTGLLGDLLSYIRLFALGLSSAILGFVFNDLASQVLHSKPVIGPIFFIVLLVFGHSMNIMMAALGSFVHPMRLTFVEFYKNAGFSYNGGTEYKPFKTNIKTT